jgi:hypothetical protein
MRGSFASKYWKPRETTGDDVVVPQGLLRLPASVVAPMDPVVTIHECLRYDGRTDELIAKAIRVSKSYMSKLGRGLLARHMRLLVDVMRHTRSIVPLQWMAHQLGCEVVVRSARKHQVQAHPATMRRAA